MVKNLPAILDTWVRSLGQENPLEKGMATPSSILAWRIPWTEGLDRLPSVVQSLWMAAQAGQCPTGEREGWAWRTAGFKSGGWSLPALSSSLMV